MDIKEKIKKIFTLRLLITLIIGAIAGYAYYYFIGCNSGGCSITSDPYRMTAFGMVTVALLFHK